MKTKISTYSDMSQIDDAMLESVIRHEERALGREDYREGLFCTNAECRRVEAAKDNPEECSCADCGSPMLAIFDPRVIKPIIYADLYRGAYGSVLTDESEEVRGTCVIQATNLRDCFNNMNYLGSHDWSQFRDRVEEVFGIEASDDTPAICSNRLCVDREFRQGGMFMKIGTACADIMEPEHSEWPSFSSVKTDGAALPVLEGIGHRRLVEDQHGAVLIGMKRFGDFRRAFAMSQEEFGKEFGAQITAATIAIRQNKTPKGPRYYRGVAMLDEIQRAVENLPSEKKE